MKITLYNISEPNLFLEALKSCRGNILLQVQDGEWYDIGKQAGVIQSFFQMRQDVDKIVLRLKIGSDVERLYRFIALQ